MKAATAGHQNPALWGPEPTQEEFELAKSRNAGLLAQARKEVLDHSLTVKEASQLLHISPRTIQNQLATGAMIGLKERNQWRLPRWQIDPDAKLGVIEGLVQLRQVFADGTVALTQWAMTENVDLKNVTPADALHSGLLRDVIAVAERSVAGQ